MDYIIANIESKVSYNGLYKCKYRIEGVIQWII
jgi:hypothetical protein